MNELVRQEQEAPSLAVIDRGMLPLAEVVSRVRRIQEIMSTLMKPDVHYGKVPGTDKPTLYQPGAELLCTTFRVAPKPTVEDLSTGDEIRYRVTMAGVNQATGELLGEGVGECSSNEEKYRFRRPVCDEEWAETPEDRRRQKWARGREKAYQVKQVRTSPADVANTVLKMAFKRALISMTRVVLACSDIFHQDLEDLPDEVRESVLEGERKPEPKKEPQRTSAKTTNGNGQATKPDKEPEPRVASAPVRVLDVVPRKGQRSDFFEISTTAGAFLTFSKTVALELESFKGTAHAVILSYISRWKDGTEYRNVESFVAADHSPVKAPSADDIFGGSHAA